MLQLLRQLPLCGFAFALVISGCASQHSPLVSEDASTIGLSPIFNEIADETAVTAYEVGRCESDADCVRDACGGATCAAEGLAPVCIDHAVGECMKVVEDSDCGCVNGFCRWERNAQTLLCASLDRPEAGTRFFPGLPDVTYPIRSDQY